MTSLSDTNGSVFGYAFDGEGNRTRQSLNDCLSTRFVYDGPNGMMELNASNEVIHAYVNGPGVDQPIERIDFINGTPRNRQVFHVDGLGSITALTDESGEAVQTYAYEAFGKIRARTGADLNRITFTAREAMGDSLGFYYYRNRVLDPNTGRFTSEDPLGFVDGASRYVYCANNPVHIIDPMGLAWYDDWHYGDRDALNRDLPSSPEDAANTGGDRVPDSMNRYHDNGDECPETKYIFPDGREVVYDGKTGNLVTDPNLKGTYNYVNPAVPSWNPLTWPGAASRGVGHFFADMLPYYVWGNDRPSDCTE